jgi:hypothetical protein
MKYYRLFFCCRNSDFKQISELQRALEKVLPNFPFEDVSKQVPTCDNWKEKAKPILASSHAVICIVGTDTHSSEPIDWELRESHRQGKPIMAISLSEKNILPPACADLSLEIIQWKPHSVAGRIGEMLVPQALFPDTKNQESIMDTASIWNQYSLMVQTWEALISRRQRVNTVYISAVAALLSLGM